MIGNSPNFNLASKAMRRVGRILLRDFVEVRQLQASVKGTREFTERAWQVAESSLLEELKETRPYYGYQCRKLGSNAGADPTRQWVINAMEGVANFSRGLPRWALSVALVHKNQTVLSLIYDALENEMFAAEKGVGSWLNGTRIRTSKKARLSEFVAATEFSGRSQELESQVSTFERVVRSVENVRLLGAVSLDLASVSCGRLDAYWNDGVTPSDLPAAAHLVAEAGGLIETIDSSKGRQRGLIAAGNTGFAPFALLLRSDAAGALATPGGEPRGRQPLDRR